MVTQTEFSRITELPGVKNHLLVKKSGELILTDFPAPEDFAETLVACGREADCLGSSRFTFLLFNRESCEHLFIFPVGNYYLGVIKERDADSKAVADEVIAFIKAVFSVHVSTKASGGASGTGASEKEKIFLDSALSAGSFPGKLI